MIAATALGTLCLLGLGWAYARAVAVPRRRERRHIRCLNNIHRLERELGFGLAVSKAQRAWEAYEYGPGATWPVEDGGKAQWLEDSPALAAFAARGVLHSAEIERYFFHGRRQPPL